MTIEQALGQVRERVAQAALRVGRQPSEVRLIAVSKTFPAQAVREAIDAGQRDFGENRVEEAVPKMAAQEIVSAGQPVHWHLIGHLQSRKAKEVVGAFDLIHSIDSLKLAQTLDRRAGMLPERPIVRVLLECNVSGEASKEGFDVSRWQSDPAVFDHFVREVGLLLALPNIEVNGLMTMAPIVDQPEQARPFFAQLRALRDALCERYPEADWSQLSMGMSDDFEAAIAEGSTMVRIGRAIFGMR